MSALSPIQQRLMRELPGWMILALADVPDYWCKHLRDGQGGGSAHDVEWRTASVWRQTYSWGIAMTAMGDYMHARKRDDQAHAAAITWREITRWVESLPPELRAEARRQRKGDDDAVRAVVDQLLAYSEAEQGALR